MNRPPGATHEATVLSNNQLNLEKNYALRKFDRTVASWVASGACSFALMQKHAVFLNLE